jgi:D-aminopeptidase
MERHRIRELGIIVGDLSPGHHNAITDVAGVRVGHTTLISGDGPLIPGIGPVRTGVTVVVPHGGNLFREKVRAAVYTINGFGKTCGFEQVRELGEIEAPIALTNTLNVGLVLDAVVQYAIRQSPEIGIRTGTVNGVVGETNDGYLNDIQGRHVHAEHVWSAIESAAEGQVQEGAVGAGTGTCCFGWKGGIGAASRVLPVGLGGFTLGALVQSNFGEARDLMIAGVAVGRELLPDFTTRPAGLGQGSVMVVLATDAPLDARQLQRLCVRSAAGLARTGSYFGHGSGDFVIGFSTANRFSHSHKSQALTQSILSAEDQVINGLFQAVIESVEEAVLNSLSCANTMVGRDGNIAFGLPLEDVIRLVRPQSNE